MRKATTGERRHGLLQKAFILETDAANLSQKRRRIIEDRKYRRNSQILPKAFRKSYARGQEK